MGKGRGKGKKQSVIAKRGEYGNEKDKDSAYRRSGIQQKSLKDEIDEVEEASRNTEDGENMEVKNSSTENKGKRKRPVAVKEQIDPVKEENPIRTKRNPDDSKNPAGFRQNGSRRKNKPRRAAEAGVNCNLQREHKNEWLNEDEDLHRFDHDQQELGEKLESKYRKRR